MNVEVAQQGGCLDENETQRLLTMVLEGLNIPKDQIPIMTTAIYESVRAEISGE
jgi:hypothetical protein